jgi:hypothetical protein
MEKLLAVGEVGPSETSSAPARTELPQRRPSGCFLGIGRDALDHIERANMLERQRAREEWWRQPRPRWRRTDELRLGFFLRQRERETKQGVALVFLRWRGELVECCGGKGELGVEL